MPLSPLETQYEREMCRTTCAQYPKVKIEAQDSELDPRWAADQAGAVSRNACGAQCELSKSFRHSFFLLQDIFTSRSRTRPPLLLKSH